MSVTSKIELLKFLIKTYKGDLGDSGIRFLNYDVTKQQKRVLICYLDYKYAQRAVMDGTVYSTNIIEFFQIISYFARRNYCIDIVKCNQSEYLESKYDIIFGLGNQFRMAVKTNPDAVKILYYAENPYEVSKKKENERIEYFFKRHRIKGDVQRTGVYYKEGDTELADHIICLGERSLFRKDKVHRLPATGFFNNDFNFSFKKKNCHAFLWLGSSGIIHKGLDILVDVFSRHKEWKLYVCGAKQWELKSLKMKLKDHIVDCDFVDINSNRFLNIVSECVYILLPSCSEGISTGVLTGMRHGLIPVVMRDTGFNEFKDYVHFFPDYHEEIVEHTICKLLEFDSHDVEMKSREVYEFANKEFAIDKYNENLKGILDKIVL